MDLNWGGAWLRDAVPYPAGRYHDVGAVNRGVGACLLFSFSSWGDSPLQSGVVKKKRGREIGRSGGGRLLWFLSQASPLL